MKWRSGLSRYVFAPLSLAHISMHKVYHRGDSILNLLQLGFLSLMPVNSLWLNLWIFFLIVKSNNDFSPVPLILWSIWGILSFVKLTLSLESETPHIPYPNYLLLWLFPSSSHFSIVAPPSLLHCDVFMVFGVLYLDLSFSYNFIFTHALQYHMLISIVGWIMASENISPNPWNL